MTYQRDPDSFAAAWTAAARCLGEAGLAGLLGVSEGRVRQMKNPMRNDNRVLRDAARADAAMLRAGAGAPILEAYRAALVAAGGAGGAGGCPGFGPRAAIAAAVAALRGALRLLEAALTPAGGAFPAPVPVAAPVAVGAR